MSRTLAAALVLLACGAPAGAQVTTLTLDETVQRAVERSDRGRAARALVEAAEHRADAFRAGLLPRLTLSGTVPSYNRSIIEVLQPDGSTLYRPQDLTNAALTATVSQPLLVTGGDVFVSSSLARAVRQRSPRRPELAVHTRARGAPSPALPPEPVRVGGAGAGARERGGSPALP